MGKNCGMFLAMTLLVIALACGGSDDVGPGITLVPTLGLKPTSVEEPAARSASAAGDPSSIPTPEPTLASTVAATVEPTITEEAAPTETSSPTAIPQTKTLLPNATHTVPPPTDTPLPTDTALPTATVLPTATPAPTSTPLPPTFTATPEGPVNEIATVVNVVDGDTIDVNIGGTVYPLRYIGIDSPEWGQPFFDEAYQANSQLVSGQTVMLVKDVSETDQYGRLLRYVYLQDGTHVNAELVRLGFASAVTYPPDTAYSQTFSALQKEAQSQGRGLWGQPAPTSTIPPAPAPTQPPSSAVCSCGGNLYNCGDFSTHNQAQSCHDYCMTQVGYDIHRLDGDNDGSACESLP